MNIRVSLFDQIEHDVHVQASSNFYSADVFLVLYFQNQAEKNYKHISTVACNTLASITIALIFIIIRIPHAFHIPSTIVISDVNYLNHTVPIHFTRSRVQPRRKKLKCRIYLGLCTKRKITLAPLTFGRHLPLFISSQTFFCMGATRHCNNKFLILITLFSEKCLIYFNATRFGHLAVVAAFHIAVQEIQLRLTVLLLIDFRTFLSWTFLQFMCPLCCAVRALFSCEFLLVSFSLLHRFTDCMQYSEHDIHNNQTDEYSNTRDQKCTTCIKLFVGPVLHFYFFFITQFFS